MNMATRIICGILFIEAAVVGAWNALLPESFYTLVPTVNLTPPFSDHYARDFGWALLGISGLLGWAMLRPRPHYVVPASAAYAIFAVPHVFYHLAHLEHASQAEAVTLTAANAAFALLPLVLIVLGLLQSRRDRVAAHRVEL